MAGMSIIAKLGLSSKDFSNALSKVEKDGKNFASNFGKAVANAMKVAGTAILGFATKGVVDVASFEKKITEVFTLIPDAGQQAFKDLEDGIRSLSVTMGVDLDDAVAGLYQALSAGVPQGNAIDFLKTATKASIAGVSTLETSVGALTTIINGYGMKMTEADRVSDVLFSTVKNGVTNFTELGQNIGKATPIASALGVSIEELASEFVVLTKQMGSGQTAQAGTAIRSMLSELAKEGLKAHENFGKLGQGSFPEFIKKGGSVTDALRLMEKEAKKNGNTLIDMFRGVEAGNGALMLMTQNGESASKALEAIEADAGSVGVAFNAMEQTTKRDFDKIKTAVTDLSIEFGNAFLPLVQNLLPDLGTGLNNTKDKVRALGQIISDSITTVIRYGTEIGALVGALTLYKTGVIASEIASGLLTTKLRGTTRAFKTFAIALNALALGNFSKALTASRISLVAFLAPLAGNPLGLFMVGLGAIIAPLVLFKKELADATDEAKKAEQFWKNKLVTTVNELNKKVSDGKSDLEGLRKKLKELRDQNQAGINIDVKITTPKDYFQALEDSIKNEKSRIKLLEDQATELEKLVKKQKENVDNQRKANELSAKTKKGTEDTLTATKFLNLELIKLNEEESKLLKKQIELEQAKSNLNTLSDDLLKSREDAKKVEDDILANIKKSRENFALSKTELGRIELLSREISKLEGEKKDLIDKAKDARVLEGNEADRLKQIETDILTAKGDLKDLILQEMIKAHQDEIDVIAKKNLEVKKILDAENLRLQAIKDQKDAKAQELADLRAQLALAETDLDKFNQFFKRFNGKLVINGGAIAREFSKLKKAGTLPNNVKTVQDFRDLIYAQAQTAYRTRQDIIDQGKQTKKQYDQILADEKIALQNRATLELQIKTQRDAMIAKEKQIEAEKKKNLDALVQGTAKLGYQFGQLGNLNLLPPQFPGTITQALNQQAGNLQNIDSGMQDLLKKNFLNPNAFQGLNMEATQKKIVSLLSGFFINQ